jgi:hypothetical protein
MPRRRILGVALFAAAIAISAIAASSASAVLLRLPNGQVTSYQPLRSADAQFQRGDTAFGNLDYNGGPVMPSNTDYLIAWSPTGAGAYGSPEYLTGIEQYWKDLQHDSGGNQNVDSTSTQYNDLTGAFARYKVTFGGLFVDRDPYPASGCPKNPPVTECLTDAQLQTELEHFASVHSLHIDLAHEFFLVTPPHVEGCFAANPASGCSAGFVPQSDAVYCAYHQQTTHAPMLFYADDPFVTGNAGCDDGNHPNGPSDGALEGGMAHEHNESITDPIPNDAWTNGAGTNHGEENGDQCDGVMGPSLGTHNGAMYNQVINGHFYWYQEMWSNDGWSCRQRFTLPSTLPKAVLHVTHGSGLAMNFNATGSTAPGGIADYSWQFNAVNNASTVETTTPTTSFTFPQGGPYSVGLAVFSPVGFSIGTGGIVRPGLNGLAPGFSFTTSGLTANFKGLTNISRINVSNTLWEFGDGGVGYGASVAHTYAKPGTYKVEVVQFSGVGSAFPGQGAAPISFRNVTVY